MFCKRSMAGSVFSNDLTSQHCKAWRTGTETTPRLSSRFSGEFTRFRISFISPNSLTVSYFTRGCGTHRHGHFIRINYDAPFFSSISTRLYGVARFEIHRVFSKARSSISLEKRRCGVLQSCFVPRCWN